MDDQRAVPATSHQPPATRGPGAPRGNLNALKSGASSRQLKALVHKLLLDPELRRLILAFAHKQQLQNRWMEGSINAYVAQLRRQTCPERSRRVERAKREPPRRYQWLPYYEEGEAPF